jgi:hypothetical protein
MSSMLLFPLQVQDIVNGSVCKSPRFNLVQGKSKGKLVAK